MKRYIRPLSKFHLFAKMVPFDIFPLKFFDHVATHALKILAQICTKSSNFIKQSEFGKRSIFFLLLLASCQTQPSSSSKITRSIAGISFQLQLPPLDPALHKEAVQLVDQTFKEMDTIYNDWNPQSEISKFNALPAHEKMTLSPQLFNLLSLTQALVHLTEGRFDPSVAPLSKLWKEALSHHTIPSSEEIKKREKAVGWHHIHLENGCAWKDHSLTALDLGAITKGYALDQLAEGLIKKGINSFYAEWGGEIRTHGLHPQGRPWKIAILGLTTIETEDSALATSGDYYQKWKINDKTYTHFIDPYTHLPLLKHPHGITTTSVKAPSCAIADALATALMLFPSSEEATAWAESLGGSITCWIGSEDK